MNYHEGIQNDGQAREPDSAYVDDPNALARGLQNMTIVDQSSHLLYSEPSPTTSNYQRQAQFSSNDGYRFEGVSRPFHHVQETSPLSLTASPSHSWQQRDDDAGAPSYARDLYAGSTFDPNAAQVYPGRNLPVDYDPLAAAASNVLGIGPPPVIPTSLVGDNTYFGSNDFENSSIVSRGSSLHRNNERQNDYGENVNTSPSMDELRSYNPQSSSSALHDSDDFDLKRPTLHRSGTTSSVSLGTRKIKAVDLSAPPFTKEFIDQYRQRIKSDPDPEAHFKYAKYLIDAARKIGENATDQRAVRKYRELLIQEALKVVRRLATQGDAYADAQFFLANCHGTGMLGLQVDHERAYHLYLQAAKQNHSAASYRVAVCNEIGAGTRRDPPRAFAFYRKAASLGDTAAMYKLGMVLLSGGLGQPKNPREAVAWLRRAAEQADEDNPHSLHELGLLHENPDSQIVPYDPTYAKNLFSKAAQLGYTQSQYRLGQCYEYGSLTCPVDPKRSIAWYTRAAEKGNAEAELALSGWYLTGSDGVLKQSDSEAYLWARRAANKGLSKAEYAVGYYAEIGIGVKQDMELAKRWYMRAAGQYVDVRYMRWVDKDFQHKATKEL